MIAIASLMLAVTAIKPEHVPARSQEIVVTGRRLSETENALRDCLARQCSVEEDINASLAHAENLMLSGDYRGSRSILRHSLGRNKDKARLYPEPVSDLHRANALVARHLGFDADYRISTINIYRALKAGIPVDDYRHLQAKMEIAAMTTKVKGLDSGERAYLRVANEAREMGRSDIAVMAEVRAARLIYRRHPGSAKSRLRRIIEHEAQKEPSAANFARLVLASALGIEGRRSEADQLLSEIAWPATKPILLYSPPLALSEQSPLGVDELPEPSKGGTQQMYLGFGSTLLRPSRDFERMWVDVAFLVQPNGTVSDVEIVRSEKDDFWAERLVKSIEGRRYTRFSGSAPYPRLERYTYTAAYEQGTGTHLAVRSPRARIEYLDLTSPEVRGKD